VRLKITLAYDGRAFDGWQSQPGGNTIQDHLERAAAEIAKGPVKVHGSGRTDAGVHALGQVAHFDPPAACRMNPFNWVPALNTKLPAAIRVLTAEEVGGDFHARFSAVSKIYRYDLNTEPVLSPFRVDRVWHLPRQLDPETLETALEATRGTHDFQAFAAKRGNETPETDYRRTLTETRLEAVADGWRLTWTGDGFLYKMVRLLTGSVLEVAQGRLPPDDLAALLDQRPGLPRGRANFCAPAAGLYLEAVEYQ
jgi:tRNA pseudouridine38-40 synthase